MSIPPAAQSRDKKFSEYESKIIRAVNKHLLLWDSKLEPKGRKKQVKEELWKLVNKDIGGMCLKAI